MQKEMLDTILSEFKKLNERLKTIEKENENKFALIDARFNTLEGIVLSMQNDIGNMKYQDDRYRNLDNRIRKIEIKVEKLSVSNC